MTDSELLAQMEASITYQLGGNVSEYEVDGRRVLYLSIDKLYEMRRKLQCSVNRQQTGVFATVEIRGTRRGWPV